MATENESSIPSLTPREGIITPRAKRKRARALLLVRSRSQHDVRATSNPSSPRGKKREEEWEEEKEERERQEGAELSIDPRAPGLLKIFGESVVAGAQYKTVLASTRSTAQELIKQALERYGLPARLHREFVLCEVAGRVGALINSPTGQRRQGGNPSRADRRAKQRGERGGSGRIGHLFRSRSKSPGRDKRKRQQQQTPQSARLDDSDKTKHRNGILLGRARSSSPPCDNTEVLNSATGKSKQASNIRVPKLAPCISSGSSRCSLVLSKGHCDSPRTPLGSPRTPCGSPSTSRGSPRTTSDPLEHSPGISHSPRRSGSSYRGSQNILPERHSELNGSQRFIHNGHKLQDRFSAVRDGGLSVQNFEDGLESRYEDIREVKVEGESQGQETEDTEWTEVSVRVLSNKDKPLQLQGFWKPPEGLFRRFELRRRRDIIMSLDGNDSNDDTFGLNDNARKIMISKVSPGVIPVMSPRVADVEDDGDISILPSRRTTLKEEWDKASMMTNATLTYGSPRSPSTINAVEGDARQAYVCPSIYPYLLTLRGCSIQKDLVLYPLKSRSLSIGSSEKKGNSDDICLCAEDVLPVHCRVTLKRLPQGETEESVGAAGDQRLYWYCLDLDIYASAYITVNGVQVKQKASIYPGDLLGVGRQYLFLYKDPTGGHDIPSAVPWLPADKDVIDPLYAHICKDLKENQKTTPILHHSNGDLVKIPDPSQTDHLNPQEYNDSDELNDSALRDAAIFLAYHRDKEVEVLEAIAEVNCSGKDEFPSSLAVLFLAAHHYSVRKFSGDHQTTFFKRLVRVIRAKVGVIVVVVVVVGGGGVVVEGVVLVVVRIITAATKIHKIT
ncbi:Ras-associated and pleckstrin-like protein domains-containing protein 1 [Elysia marginata]|uniref:Ras-associated and pleckstrin-like protein domains-containing protein 1 n=1 Tax=Elysia marginata TaxID=1093978 RepID=A0AAV4IW74_9GAST|nr:Ras-associated and pleckstrin-like protein domains-containing protein 1 [Elysia marginata]